MFLEENLFHPSILRVGNLELSAQVRESLDPILLLPVNLWACEPVE